jgi:MFS family permease
MASGTAPRHRPAWIDRTIGAMAQIADNRAIVRLQLAYLILFGATAMVLVAQAVVAFTEAGAGGVAVLTLAQMLPTLVIVPLVAALGQRVERRRLLVAALLACLVATAGTTVLLALDGPFIGLLALAALLAVGAGVGWSVITAMLPDLAHDPEELVGANVAATTAEAVGGLLGPLLASLLLVVSGPAGVCLAATVGLAGAIASAVGVRPPPVVPVARLHRSGGRVRALAHEVSEGGRILLHQPGTRLIALGAMVQTFVRGALGVLVVVFAFDVLGVGDEGVGWLNAAIGLGGLVGAALTAALMIGRPLGTAFGLSLVFWGLPLVLLAPVPSMPAALLALTVAGIANSFLDVSAFGLLQGSVPDRQRTAALGAVRSIVSLGMAAGGIGASLLLLVLEPPVALGVVGALLPVLVVLRRSDWRRLDDGLLVPREQVAALRACRLFAPFTLAQLEQLAAGSTTVRHPAGTVLITEGEPGDAFYLLTEGSVEVTVAGTPVSTLGPGQGFGEIALLRGTPRTATVTATSPVVAFRVDAPTFVSAVSGSVVSRETAEETMRGYVHAPAG